MTSAARPVNGDRLHLAYDSTPAERERRAHNRRVWLQIGLTAAGLFVGFLAGIVATVVLLMALAS